MTEQVQQEMRESTPVVCEWNKTKSHVSSSEMPSEQSYSGLASLSSAETGTTTISPICEECHRQPAIYQCPRCSFRSCSLPCCQRHKQLRGCNGKRDRTAFLPISQMNDGTLQSDYFFLEDVLNQVQRQQQHKKRSSMFLHDHQGRNDTGASQHTANRTIGKRPRTTDSRQLPTIGGNCDGNSFTMHPLLQAVEIANRSNGIPGNLVNHHQSQHKQATPPKRRILHQQALQRSIQLLFVPVGMSRHAENRSYYNRNTNRIHWTVEWLCYDHDESGKRHDHVINEEGPDVDSNMGHSSSNERTSKDLTTVRSNTSSASQSAVSPARTPVAQRRGTVQMEETTAIVPALERQALQQGVGVSMESTSSSCYTFLWKRLPCPAHRQSFVSLTRTATLADTLPSTIVYEFPTIHIVATSRLNEFFGRGGGTLISVEK